MKTISAFVILFALSANLVFGQQVDESGELVSKNGHPILPETGDWGIGFNAIPLIDFALNAVNIMNNTGQTAENPGYVEGFDQIITGKYFITPQRAYRIKFGVNIEADNFSNYFDDPLDTSGDPQQLEDVFKERNTELFASGGIELRRGSGRLQGFYGAEGLLSFSSSADKFEYGLEWNTEAETAGLVVDGQSRTLVARDGREFGLGGRGFIGVEYFFAPKMSIALEYGIGLVFTLQGRGKTTLEVYEGGSTTETEVAGNTSQRGFTTAVDNANAAVSLFLHF